MDTPEEGHLQGEDRPNLDGFLVAFIGKDLEALGHAQRIDAAEGIDFEIVLDAKKRGALEEKLQEYYSRARRYMGQTNVPDAQVLEQLGKSIRALDGSIPGISDEIRQKIHDLKGLVGPAEGVPINHVATAHNIDKQQKLRAKILILQMLLREGRIRFRDMFARMKALPGIIPILAECYGMIVSVIAAYNSDRRSGTISGGTGLPYERN